MAGDRRGYPRPARSCRSTPRTRFSAPTGTPRSHARGSSTDSDDISRIAAGFASLPPSAGPRKGEGHAPDVPQVHARRLGGRICWSLASRQRHSVHARREPDIGATTDVADHPEFASRQTTRTIDGVVFSSTWFTFDFTLAELKTLRAKERLPLVRPQNTALDGLFEVPTFQEVIDLATSKGVGIYPETKHPTFFQSLGFSFDAPLLGTLRRNGLDRPTSKVFIQSFEVGNLQRLRRETRLPLIQLIDSHGAPADFVASGDPRTYDDLVTPQGLAEIATYADGIGP